MAVRFRFSLSIFVAASLAATACTSNDSDDSAASSPPDTATAETTEELDSSDDAATDDDTTEASAEPLGFDVDRFEIPVPVVEEDLPAFGGSDELIDAGIDAGVWSEPEAVRAIVSIIMGELPPEAVPALDELPHPSIPALLDRAADLLAGNELADAERADLERLTEFFFDPSSDSTTADAETSAGSGEGGDDSEPQGIRSGLVGSARAQAAASCPPASGLDGESKAGVEDFFDVEVTGVAYCELSQGEDSVLYPLISDDESTYLGAALQILDLIPFAREGYQGLAGTEMPPVRFLISARSDPEGDSFGHVVSAKLPGRQCVGAIFATSGFFAEAAEFRNTVAHELFHCVQAEWEGLDSDNDFVFESGASYFAYRLLGECSPEDVSRGSTLDQRTATGSLLDSEYDGWFFWAFLDEHGHLDSNEISRLHQRVKVGTAVEDALGELLPDVSKTLNEFYVRMVGPKLACGFQGDQFTGEKTAKEVGAITFADAPWQGTRYKVTYPQKRYFEQSAGDTGLIGMADFDKRSAEGAWVVTEPEIRTTCNEAEDWIVVLAGATDSSVPDRMLSIDKRNDGECDPCPFGKWAIDLETMATFFESYGEGIDVQISGSWTLDFDGASGGGATLEDERQIVLTFPGLAGPDTGLSVNGSGSGGWQGDETVLVLSNYVSEGEASFFGVSASQADGGTDAGLGYGCDEDGLLTITSNGVTIVANRLDPVKGTPYFE